MQPNFYLDDGIEKPIRYKAEDLINKLPQPGYHWEQDLRAYKAAWEYVSKELKIAEDRGSIYPFFSLPNLPDPMYYIAVPDGGNND